jgi:hypothetical protein
MTETDESSEPDAPTPGQAVGDGSRAATEPEPATRNPMLVLAIGVPVVLLTWLLWRWMYAGEPYIPKRVPPATQQAPQQAPR